MDGNLENGISYQTTGAELYSFDINPIITDVKDSMSKNLNYMLNGFFGDYRVFKETHLHLMETPIVKHLVKRIQELEQAQNQEQESNGGRSVDYMEYAKMARSVEQQTGYIRKLETQVTELQHKISVLQKEAQENVSLHVIDEMPAEEEPVKTVETKLVSISENTTIKNKIVEEEVEEEEDDDEVEEEDDNDDEVVKQPSQTQTNPPLHEDDDDEEEEEEEEEKPIEQKKNTVVKEVEEEEEEVEEEEEEEEDEQQEEDVEEEEEDEQQEEDVEEEEEEVEVSEVMINGKAYFTSDEKNGIIYSSVDDDVGDEVGVFKNGIAVFHKKK